MIENKHKESGWSPMVNGCDVKGWSFAWSVGIVTVWVHGAERVVDQPVVGLISTDHRNYISHLCPLL